jgi:hypothetical protein
MLTRTAHLPCSSSPLMWRCFGVVVFQDNCKKAASCTRSPRIDGLGLRRLVLVLDVPKACSIVSPLTTRPAPAAIDRSAGAL